MNPYAVAASLAALSRLGAYEFLRDGAAPLWAEMMDRGINFVVPAEISLDLDPARAAKQLAAIEAERIRTARTYFLGPDAAEGLVKGVLEQVHRGDRAYVLDPDLMPDAPTGFLLWGSSIGDGGADSPITAIHWEKRDNFVQVAWWTDTGETVARRLEAGTMTTDEAAVAKAVNWPLNYEREHFLPYGSNPDGISSDGDLRLMILTRITIASWRVLAAHPAATVNLPADERALFAAADLSTDPVHVLGLQ